MRRFAFLLVTFMVAACGPAAPTPGATVTVAAPTSSPTAGGVSQDGEGTPAEARQFRIIAQESQACYRVREQLANVTLPGEAVGCTQDVEGVVMVLPDGTVVPESSRVQVNLSTLTSDESRRDRYVRSNTLETDRYPHATFVPRTIIDMPSPLPASGEVTFQVVGDLTLREVTREVTWEVTATVSGDRILMQAQTEFSFDEFQLERPRVPIVLAVEDPIRLEVSLVWEEVP